MGWEREKNYFMGPIFCWEGADQGLVLKSSQKESQGQNIIPKGKEELARVGLVSCLLPVAGEPVPPSRGAHLPDGAVGLPGLVRAGELRLV